jgi:amino acid adenylation domain-containing protein
VRREIADRKDELLQFLRTNNQSAAFSPPPILRRTSKEPAPLSFAQERLWFLEQLEPGIPVYNLCRASRIIGELNTPALEASLNELVRRHEVLRSAIRMVKGRPMQIVQRPFKLKLSIRDLQRMPDVVRQSEIGRRIQEAGERSFDFAAGKLLRSELIRVSEDEHILIFASHHIASDAWSMAILSRELWSLYKANATGGTSPLKYLPIQYADFALWQRECLQGTLLESQLSYWKKQLNDLPILNLTTNRARPSRQSYRGARVSIALPESLTATINHLSNESGVTPFMTLLAAFQVLLYRYSGQEDIVVGSPIANRRRCELEPLVGFFVNTLVLRADLSGNPTFKELLAHVRNVCLAAYEHQDLPFEKLVQEVKPDRDQSRNPLFQVMFVLQNATRAVAPLDDLRIEPIETENRRSLFDLSLFLRERNGRYIGCFEYNTDLFDALTIEQMGEHIQKLLEGIVANPDQPISMIPLFNAVERRQLLVEWNDTTADYPTEKCIHQLFEEQVERTSDRIAISFNHQELTYAELNARANQLAEYLQGLGVRPESLVGICVERSLEMVIGVFGILKAGGAYLPLDPAYPEERLKFMLEDAQVSVVVTQEKLKNITQYSALNARHFQVCLDRDWTLIAQEGNDNPKSRVGSANLAYVIYTSGSTGQPKAVAIEHRNTLNLLHWAKSVYTPQELRGVLASTSICFDLSVFELFVTLSCGGTVILAENALFLLKHPEAKKVTLVNTVPSVMTALMAAGPLPSSVCTVNLAGEPLRRELVKQIYDLGTVEKVYDLYGPSETTTYSSFAPRTPDGPATIGRPIANTRIYLLDAHRWPVPIGMPGEIYVGGAGVARGYLNRPDLTREKFVNDPFSHDPGDRLYKTGDLARYLSDGSLEFLGRADSQVKIHGYRIELGEIKAVLNQHPAVKENVVVVGPRDSLTEDNLIGYVVPTQQSLSLIAELRDYLRQRLPHYMIPPTFVILDSLPLAPNGKIDLNALPPPEPKTRELLNVFTKPRTPVEEIVFQIWREVLKVENIGIYDNFFELGGYSLLAIQVVVKLREAFDWEIPLRTLFDTPTVAGLSEEIEKRPEQTSGAALPPIKPVPRDGPLAVSPNQEHLWRLDKLFQGNHFFSMPYVYQINGNLNLAALERTIEKIMNRHEALRAYFPEVHGRPVQMARPAVGFRLPIVDLRNREANEISDSAAGAIFEERQQPFNLATGPLIRVKLLWLTDDAYFLLITTHHIISDEWSVGVFRRELVEFYQAFSTGCAAPFPEPLIQYGDFASWEVQILDDGLLNEQLDYWRKQLASPLPQIHFKNVRIRKRSLSFQTTRKQIEFSKNLSAAIKMLSAKEHVTPFIVLVSVLNVLLHIWTGEQDIRIGALVANRARKDTEGTIGPFVNTVVLRTIINPTMTLHDLLERVHTGFCSALANQELPFEHLARVLEKERRIRRTSLFQVLVKYHDSSLDSVTLPGTTFAPLRWQQPGSISEVMLTACDMVFDIRAAATQFTGNVNYKNDTVGNNIVADIIPGFGRIVERMLLDMGATASSIA